MKPIMLNASFPEFNIHTPMNKEFYTVDEIAELLRIRPGTLRNWLCRDNADLPPSVVIGRRRLFPQSGYETWKQKHLAEPHLAAGRRSL